MKEDRIEQEERRKEALYPTWFRWKANLSNSFRKSSSSFISHMVQMKACWDVCRVYAWRLYIPHGSDESKSCASMRNLLTCLYIPHGSDESAFNCFIYLHLFFLYIPHGSDERWLDILKKEVAATLYPTWFRWKLADIEKLTKDYSPLYPTWFRWKWKLLKWAVSAKNALYPTWFRWKAANQCKCLWSTCLYIPHGSDERLCLDPCEHRNLIFISHMVQMKVGFVAPTTSISGFALYPTWFRWKVPLSSLTSPETPLYIPHGSDESQHPATIEASISPLYPTWFRWKPLEPFIFTSFRLLYIPHGSDESAINH